MSPKDRVSAFTAQLAKGVAQSHHMRISFLYRRLILRKEDSFFQNDPLVLEIFSIFHRNPLCKQFVCLGRSAVEPAHREFQILGFHKPCIWAVLGTFLRKSLKRTFNSQVTSNKKRLDKGFNERADFLGDAAITTAILDRLAKTHPHSGIHRGDIWGILLDCMKTQL